MLLRIFVGGMSGKNSPFIPLVLQGDCKTGDTVKLSAVINTSSDFLKYLNSREMQLGLKIKVKSIEAFDKSMVVTYGKHQIETLSHIVCDRLLVEKE